MNGKTFLIILNTEYNFWSQIRKYYGRHDILRTNMKQDFKNFTFVDVCFCKTFLLHIPLVILFKPFEQILIYGNWKIFFPAIQLQDLHVPPVV